jgi:hypothetical protein
MKRLILNIAVIIALGTGVMYGQPSLPSNPPQAPIDGGLGLLAAAGGAYAYKKLKGKQEEEEEIE